MREYLKSEIKKIIENRNVNSWHIHIKKNIELTEQIINETTYLPINCKFNERVYNILNDITDIVICDKDGCNNSTTFQHFKAGYSKHCSIKCMRTNYKINNDKTIICEFGCNKPAKYIINGNQYCCSKGHQKCPAVRKKNSEKNTLENNAMYGKQSGNHLTLKNWYERYPFFCQIEKPKVDENGQIVVKCKSCNKWFNPGYEQMRTRRDALEHKDGNGGGYFYCSNKCKEVCPLYGMRPEYIIHDDPTKYITLNERKIWKSEVLKRQKESIGYNECEYCGNKNLNELDCHHEKPIKLFPNLALDPDNGIILCSPKSKNKCHHKIGHIDDCSLGNISNKICRKIERLNHE